MYASAEPIYICAKTLRVTKQPRYWVAYVKNEQGNILWMDTGWATKKLALKFAGIWIAKQSTM